MSAHAAGPIAHLLATVAPAPASAPAPPPSAEDPFAISPWERHPGAMAVYKSSRARPNKNQPGWGNLPEPLIHKIINIVNNDTRLDHALGYLADAPLSAPVALAVLRRHWMCQMRLVSAGWHKAINSHTFWIEYATTLRPGHDSLRNQIGPALSHFDMARGAVADVCVPCRLSVRLQRTDHPPHPATPYTFTMSRLGLLPTCRYHYHTCCAVCLREELGGPNSILLRDTEQRDMGKMGLPRPYGLMCRICREMAFAASLKRELIEINRSGPLRGERAPWVQMLSYRHYILDGVGQADAMAKRCVEEMFLIQQARLYQDITMYAQLQHELVKLKIYCYERNPAGQRLQTSQVQRVMLKLWGEDHDEYIDVSTLTRQWCLDIDSGEYGEAEHREDCWRITSNQVDLRLCISFREKLLQDCMNHWIHSRIRLGYWIMPSDELDQHITPDDPIHTPFHEFAPHVFNPKADPAYRIGARALAHEFNSCEGRFHWTPDLTYIHPPQRLLHHLNERFTTVLTRNIDLAFIEIVDHQKTITPTTERAERACEALKLPGLLHYLRMPHTWVEGGLGRRELTSRMPPSLSVSTYSGSFTPPDEKVGATEEATAAAAPGSPVVQVVAEDRGMDPDYDIRDGWSEGKDEYDEIDDKGKRKSSDGDVASSEQGDDELGRPTRPALGNRTLSDQTSDASSTTALVTPDEGPDLLPEAISVVADDDAEHAGDSAHEAHAAGGSPEVTPPTLGKRKSPDDDDREQPPLHRRSPQASLSSESGTIDTDKTDDSASVGAPEPMSDGRVVAEPAELPGDVNDENASPNGDAEIDSSVPTSALASAPPSASTSTLDEDDAPNNERAPQPTIGPPSPPNVPSAPSPSPLESHDSFEGEPLSRTASTLSSDYDYDDGWMEDVPYVPPEETNLGPAATAVISHVWWRAQEGLRECTCTICSRPKAGGDLARYLMSAYVDSGALRIA